MGQSGHFLYHCPGELRNQVNVSSLEKVKCQLLMLVRGRQFGWKHPGLNLGPAPYLFHGFGHAALPLPCASIASSTKQVKSHLPYRVMVRTK